MKGIAMRPQQFLGAVSLIVLIAFGKPGASFAQPAVSLISTGAVWKYLDNGSDQGTNWVALGFDDTGWPSGPAQLGYGDGDEATVVSFGGVASNKYTTT